MADDFSTRMIIGQSERTRENSWICWRCCPTWKGMTASSTLCYIFVDLLVCCWFWRLFSQGCRESWEQGNEANVNGEHAGYFTSTQWEVFFNVMTQVIKMTPDAKAKAKAKEKPPSSESGLSPDQVLVLSVCRRGKQIPTDVNNQFTQYCFNIYIVIVSWYLGMK